MSGLKLRIDPGLLERGIGGEALSCASINSKAAIADRAEPDFMIAFSVPHKRAAVIDQDAFQITVVSAAHQAAIGIVLS